MYENEVIEDLERRLEIYRRNLRHLLAQAATCGGEMNLPLSSANDLHEAREQIWRIKTILRESGRAIRDNPGEEAQVTTIEESAQFSPSVAEHMAMLNHESEKEAEASIISCPTITTPFHLFIILYQCIKRCINKTPHVGELPNLRNISRIDAR